MEIKKLATKKSFHLPAHAGLPESYHIFEPKHIQAIEAAWYAGRPLLIIGEPGLGKSQIAQAIAQRLEWNLLLHVVHSRSEPDDLLYNVDHVTRLAKAQIAALEKQRNLRALKHKHFVIPGPLWWAFSPESASAFFNRSKDYVTNIEQRFPGKPFVMLIDEIDKAERDLPNALLEILNNKSFHVPFYDKPISLQGRQAPFVVITSNDERPLPAAFLRRCSVLKLALDNKEQLIKVAEAHEKTFKHIKPNLIEQAAELVIKHREDLQAGDYRPGTSEFLDLLRVLDNHHGYQSDAARENALESLSEHFLHKQ